MNAATQIPPSLSEIWLQASRIGFYLDLIAEQTDPQARTDILLRHIPDLRLGCQAIDTELRNVVAAQAAEGGAA